MIIKKNIYKVESHYNLMKKGGGFVINSCILHNTKSLKGENIGIIINY